MAFSHQDRRVRGRLSEQSGNPHETFARYDSPPFRQFDQEQLPFNNAPMYGSDSAQGRPPMKRNKSSKASILHRMLSRQKHLEEKVDEALIQGSKHGGPGAGHPEGYDFDPSAGQSNVQRHGTGKRPDYSLAGPRGPPPSDQYRSYRDPDYRIPGNDEETSKPKPVWGLAKPLPRVSRGRKDKKTKKSTKKPPQKNASMGGKEGDSQNQHPKGQVGGGPAGHHGAGDATEGQPQGETAGGPAANPRRQEMEGDDWVEHLADGLFNPLASAEQERKESQDTLVDDDACEEEEEEVPNYWFRIRRRMREPFAEFLATMILILLGICGNLQVKTSNGQAGSYTQEAAVWGLATMISIYVAGGVSGAHCNPSVSIFLCVFRGFPARKAVIYIIAQTLGAVTGVVIAWGIYRDAIINFDPAMSSGSTGTGTSFFTLPNSFVAAPEAFFTDFVSSAIQAGVVLALGDDSNAPPGAGMHALIIGLVAFVLASTLGWNTGPQSNPAKDFSTRFITWLIGYQPGMWKRGWWAEAWVASIVGALIGALMYDLLIFEGSESPVNYPKRRRKEAYGKQKERFNLWGKVRARKDPPGSDEESGLEKTDSVPRL